MMRLKVNAILGFVLTGLGACGCASEPAPVAPAEPPALEASWRPFSADSPWNTKIPSDAKTDPESDILIADLANTNALYIAIREWSVPIYYIDRKTAKSEPVYQIYEGVYGRGFELGSRIPVGDQRGDFVPEKGTGFLSVVDTSRNIAWEMKQAARWQNGLWFAGLGAITNLSGTGVSVPWMKAETYHAAASPRASGAPLIAGVIRVDDIKAGRIDHALAFAYPRARTDAFIPPASTALESDDRRPYNRFGLPMGARIQLDPAFDVENAPLSPAGKIIARALQDYGAILVDDAGGTILFAESAPDRLAEWEGILDSETLQAVFTPEMMAANFRLLEMGEAMPGRPKLHN